MQILVDGHSVFAATGGRAFDASRPAIIFLHGAGLDHTCWTLQARWFAWHGWSVLAVDLPGHGRSQGQPLASIAELARWVGNLIQATGAERAALVGHSMGGAIALETAALLPDRVTKIALIATAAAIPVSDMLLGAAQDKPQSAYALMTEWAHGASARKGGNRIPGVWMTGAAAAVFARNAPGTLHTDLAACAAWATGPAHAAAVRSDALVLTAAEDIMTPAKRGAELARLIPSAKHATIDDCGHMIMSEQPDRCLDALMAHFGPA